MKITYLPSKYVPLPGDRMDPKDVPADYLYSLIRKKDGSTGSTIYWNVDGMIHWKLNSGFNGFSATWLDETAHLYEAVIL